MMKNSNIDELTKDILKNSYLEVTDPDFNVTTMKNVLRESRRQRVLENFIMCFLVFVAVDALILLVLWLIGLNVFDIPLRLENLSHELLLHIEKLKYAILQNRFMKYIFLLLVMMAIIYGLTESRLNLQEKPKQRGK